MYLSKLSSSAFKIFFKIALLPPYSLKYDSSLTQTVRELPAAKQKSLGFALIYLRNLNQTYFGSILKTNRKTSLALSH